MNLKKYVVTTLRSKSKNQIQKWSTPLSHPAQSLNVRKLLITVDSGSNAWKRINCGEHSQESQRGGRNTRRLLCGLVIHAFWQCTVIQ